MKYHEIPIQDGDFVSIEERDVDIEKGIRAAAGKLKSDPTGPAHIRAFLFDTEKWSTSEADKWVTEHKQRAGVEKRSFDTVIGFSKEDRNEVRLRGTAIPYGKLSDNPIQGMPGVKERILPGAFTKSLASGRDVMMLWNHELKYIFGRTSRATLSLHETDEGVSFDNVPPDSGWAKDLLPSIKRGDYNNMSFSFKDDVKASLTLENGGYVRNVSQATLYEISLVPFAVYETTSIGMRGADLFLLDDMVLPDPAAEQKRAATELDKFAEVEAQFNNMKTKWL
jgi:HK97 family phage prohead protease